MTNLSNPIRIDKDLENQATEVFKEMGLDLSTAINIFLVQCIQQGEIPFKIKSHNRYSRLAEALKEADEIANDDNVITYKNAQELFRDVLGN